jgi:hypothetical protein
MQCEIRAHCSNRGYDGSCGPIDSGFLAIHFSVEQCFGVTAGLSSAAAEPGFGKFDGCAKCVQNLQPTESGPACNKQRFRVERVREFAARNGYDGTWDCAWLREPDYGPIVIRHGSKRLEEHTIASRGQRGIGGGADCRMDGRPAQPFQLGQFLRDAGGSNDRDSEQRLWAELFHDERRSGLEHSGQRLWRWQRCRRHGHLDQWSNDKQRRGCWQCRERRQRQRLRLICSWNRG